MLSLTIAQKISIWILPLLFAITLHEAAHAWVAAKCGDSTAKMLGRLTINPLAHIDPLGTLFVPIVIGVLSQFQFIFGWAKPVPINWHQLRHPRRDMVLVALAGPLSNFLMAFLWAAGLKAATMLQPETSNVALFLLFTSQAGILINLILGFLNLLPIPPLDGSRIVMGMLSPKQSFHYQKMELYGFLILLLLLATGLVGIIINPLLSWSYSALILIFHL